MKTRGLFLGMLTLLMVGCSTPTPTTPASPATEREVSGASAPETTASSSDTQAAHNVLRDLALSATSTGPVVAQVRPDGTLLTNGTPVFPMGFYHVSWAGSAARRMADMKAIADMGFNTMNATMFDPQDDIGGFTKFLDNAQTRGMKILTEDFNDVSIAALKDHPALLGWMIADDCNNRVTAEQLKARHERVKALDPQHLTYTSMAISYSNSHSSYFGNADAVGNQSYPVDGGDSVGVVYPMMQRLVAESAAKGTMPIANLQSFRWENGRYPTPRELNSMTNQALGAGVKGILYYTFLDPNNDLTKYAGLNKELRTLASEVKLLAPVLLNGTRQQLSANTNLGQARANLWTYSGRRYLQVLSLHETANQAVTVTLPSSAGRLVPLFAGRPTGLKVASTRVTGTLTPLTAHWYEVQ